MTDDEPRNVTKRDLVYRVAEKLGVTKVLARDLTQLLLDEISEELVRGSRIELRDFGVFDVRVRACRVGLNPRTLEKVEVPAKRTVRFRTSRSLRERISPGAEDELELEGGAAARRRSDPDHLEDDADEAEPAPPRRRSARGAYDDESDDGAESTGSKRSASGSRRSVDASGAARAEGRPRSGAKAASSGASDADGPKQQGAEERGARSTPSAQPPPAPPSPAQPPPAPPPHRPGSPF